MPPLLPPAATARQPTRRGRTAAEFPGRRGRPPPSAPLQPHYRRVLACMAGHDLPGPVFGICWDGAGRGPDGTLWGGEFLRVEQGGFVRAGHFRTFPLPGPEAAAREPRRCALGAVYGMEGDDLFARADEPVLGRFSDGERILLRSALARRFNTASTSSAARLIAAAASLAGVRQWASFEGQEARELEDAVDETETSAYPCPLRGRAPFVLDWHPLLAALREDVRTDVPAGRIAARFLRALVEAIAQAAARGGLREVVLAGACFENGWLDPRPARSLRADGFAPHGPSGRRERPVRSRAGGGRT